MAIITITQFTVPEVLEKWSKKTGALMTQSDLARSLGISRQQLNQLKDKPIPEKYFEQVQKLLESAPDDTITLDFYPDVFGSCGNGVFEFSTRKDQLTVPKKAFFTHFSPIKQYFVINAYGDSMQPLINDRDRLIIEHWEGEQIIDNRPYVFCYKDEIFIKKLVKNINQLVIVSENKLYDTIKLQGDELSQVDIIGQVVGLMRDLR